MLEAALQLTIPRAPRLRVTALVFGQQWPHVIRPAPRLLSRQVCAVLEGTNLAGVLLHLLDAP
jgi:hypothetical protein